MKKSVKIAIIVGTALLLLLLIVILFADDSEEFEPHILKSVEEVQQNDYFTDFIEIEFY